jgi:ribokinase
MARIVVAGSLNMDLVATAPRLPGRGETVLGDGFFESPGGKGANQAYAAARLGGDVAMIGRVGDDAYGARLRASLAGAGCDVGCVRSGPEPTGVALIFVSRAGDNAIVVAPGANAGFGPAELQADAEALAECRILLLQLESPVATVTAAAWAASAAGATVILDPAPADPPPPAELLALVDILTPNETEAAQLTGRSAAAERSLGEIAALAVELQRLGPPSVIVKLGARGCLVAAGDQITHLPAPAVRAVDSTAAGDVFNAALAVALSEARPLAEAAAFAIRAATLSVTRRGAQTSAPARAEVEGG